MTYKKKIKGKWVPTALVEDGGLNAWFNKLSHWMLLIKELRLSGILRENLKIFRKLL